MAKFGPQPLPATVLRLRGTFREDRHGSRGTPDLGGAPEKPDLSEVASAFWDSVVPSLVAAKIVSAADAAELERMASLWALWRAARVEAEKSPLDKLARVACVSYGAEFGKLAARFGLSPSDRVGLGVPTEKPPTMPRRRRAQ